MKVLHVAEVVKGGVATVISELIEHQVTDNDFKSIKVLVPDSQMDELEFNDKNIIIPFRRTGRNIASFFRLGLKFITVFFSFKPDIIHLHSSFAGFICRVLLLLYPFKSVKVVYCPHAFSFMMVSSVLKRKIYSIVERILQYRTDAIICVSHHEYKEGVKYGLKKTKLVTIYNGISKANENLELQTINDLNFRKKNKFTILFVGRFDYQKGFDLLCTVIERFSHTDIDIEFKLVGGYVNQIEKRDIPICKNVQSFGWLSKDKIFYLYKRADLLVIPSRWEGFAMVPIEAFREKLPVLASSFPSFGEIVHDGKTGFIFENGDVNDLYDKIINIYSLPGREEVLNNISNNALKDYYDFFTSDIMAKKTKLVYMGFLNSGEKLVY